MALLLNIKYKVEVANELPFIVYLRSLILHNVSFLSRSHESHYTGLLLGCVANFKLAGSNIYS